MEAFVGEIRTVGFNFAPRGWALCNGQLLSISQHSALYSLLGTSFGGDGRTTFGLPDLQGRVPIHASSKYRIGSAGGAESETLTTGQIPAHAHSSATQGYLGLQLDANERLLSEVEAESALEDIFMEMDVRRRLPPSFSANEECAYEGEQCGGENWAGPTCCKSGSTCVVSVPEKDDREEALTPTYKGCFIDSEEDRDLHHFAYSSEFNSREECALACISRGYSTMGLQYGRECFCGDLDYGKYGIAPDEDCSTTCSGSPSELCGAGNRNSVYVLPPSPSSAYVGCFIDMVEDRDLTTLAYVSEANSPELCAAVCSATQYAFYGLQYGTECWCGDSYGKHGAAAQSGDCNMKCGGNAEAACGSGNRNSVYQVLRSGWQATCEPLSESGDEEDFDRDPANELQDLSLQGTSLRLSGSNSTVDLLALVHSVVGEKEAVTGSLRLNGMMLSLVLEGDEKSEVDLAPLIPENVDPSLSLVGTFLHISNGDGGVDLAPLLSKSVQSLSLSGKKLAISGGSGVDLSALLNEASEAAKFAANATDGALVDHFMPAEEASTGTAGGTLEHNNMQPFLTVNYIIALEGIYPSRS
jgi:microcystin-dependent protein